MVAQIDAEYRTAAGAAGTVRRLASYALFEGRPATTRGQWINPLVLGQYRLAARLAPSVAPDRPIFIVGVGRSGTTHLGRVLSTHQDVGWLNEPKAMWSLIHPAEDVSGFYRETASFVLDPSEVTPELRTRAYRMTSHYLRTVRATRLVDKYPELTYRIPFLKRLYPDAVIVAIVRRPGAFVRSVVEWDRQHSNANAGWWGVDAAKWHLMWRELVVGNRHHPDLLTLVDEHRSTGQERAAVEWLLGASFINRSRDLVDVLVHHEELVSAPVETLARISDACHLAPSTRTQEYARVATRSNDRDVDWELPILAQEVADLSEQLGY